MTVKELITNLLWYDMDEEIEFYIDDDDEKFTQPIFVISAFGGDKELPSIDLKRREF